MFLCSLPVNTECQCLLCGTTERIKGVDGVGHTGTALSV